MKDGMDKRFVGPGAPLMRPKEIILQQKPFVWGKDCTAFLRREHTQYAKEGILEEDPFGTKGNF